MIHAADEVLDEWIRVGAFVLVMLVVVVVAYSIHARHADSAARAAEPWRQSNDWSGTTVTSIVPMPQPVIAAFEVDPPSPEGRKTMFAFCLSPKTIVDRRGLCKGWTASIDSVKANVSGWEVEITIAAKTGVCYSDARTHETWQVSHFGRPRCIACKGSGQAMLAMCD